MSVPKEWTKCSRVFLSNPQGIGGIHVFIKGESVARALMAAKIDSDHTDLECRVDEIIADKNRAFIVLELRKRVN